VEQQVDISDISRLRRMPISQDSLSNTKMCDNILTVPRVQKLKGERGELERLSSLVPAGAKHVNWRCLEVRLFHYWEMEGRLSRDVDVPPAFGRPDPP